MVTEWNSPLLLELNWLIRSVQEFRYGETCYRTAGGLLTISKFLNESSGINVWHWDQKWHLHMVQRGNRLLGFIFWKPQISVLSVRCCKCWYILLLRWKLTCRWWSQQKKSQKVSILVRTGPESAGKQRCIGPHSPAQHQLGVLALDVFLHQLQQQRPHDVGVVFQLPVQSHRQQGGEVHLGPGVEVWAVL